MEGLARLVASVEDASALAPEYKRQIEALQEVLYALRDGEAPPPRHHMYYLESPVRATYQHHTSGQNYGLHAVWPWLGVWPFFLCVLWAQSRIARFTPMVAYALTLGTVAVFDSALVVIGMVSSPGSIAEGVELLLALVNLLAWVVLGDYFLTWTGLVLGALGWATTVSMAVLLVGDA